MAIYFKVRFYINYVGKLEMSNLTIGAKIPYQTQLAAARASSQPLRHGAVSSDLKQTRDNFNFGIAPNVLIAPQTTLVTQDEKNKYNSVYNSLNKNDKQKLDALLKTGRLLDKNSNDGSSTLDNLFRMAGNERIRGLDRNVILSETVSILHNPFVITQKFGTIPQQYQNEVISYENGYINSHSPASTTSTNLLQKYLQPPQRQHQEISAEDLNVKSNCCVAASIEFCIAHRTPAEFARMAEQLSSDKMSITKTINPNAVAINTIDSIWLLNEFATKHQFKDWNNVTVELNPDRNAIIRARVQNSYKKSGERSPIDVLMQSMIMNIGSQQTYNTLTDQRTGKFNKDPEGLTNIEKNYAECLTTGTNHILVTYQIMDDDLKLTGYECSFDEMKQQLADTLNLGQNVIVGYTYFDNNNKCIGGHEITIIGIEKDTKGVEYFICKDTDNPTPAPIKYKVNEFLPKIHHAGLPKQVLKENVEFVDAWVEVLNQFKAMRNQLNQLGIKQAA